MSKIGLWYEVILKDRNGKVVKRFKRKSESWLVGFIRLLRAFIMQRYYASVSTTPITTEDGASNQFPATSSPANMSTAYPCCNGDTGDVSQGMVVGTSDTANTLTTYALGSKIGHGTGSGQLLYSSMTFEDVVNPSGNILQFRMTRVFTNNSGADITVREFGLLSKLINSSNQAKSILIARDVLSSPITIPDGYSLTLRYIVKITVA
jgi:hypothetical protein